MLASHYYQYKQQFIFPGESLELIPFGVGWMEVNVGWTSSVRVVVRSLAPGQWLDVEVEKESVGVSRVQWHQ